jgi:hypothetical protein
MNCMKYKGRVLGNRLISGLISELVTMLYKDRPENKAMASKSQVKSEMVC